MGSVMSGVYNGFQYVTGCTGDRELSSNSDSSLALWRATPFVLKRTSSMFFDEDGDLAHEFYEEVWYKKSKKSKGHRTHMKRITNNRLLPEGVIDLLHPRLHGDFPLVLCNAY